MKPALISKNRLKINVTAEDLLRLNISYEMLDYRDLRVRDILNNIIEIACEQTGFNKENEKILVETVPQAGGGCVICVTRLPGKKGVRRDVYRRVGTSAEPYIFAFDSLNLLLTAGGRILAFSDVILSELAVYYCQGIWYLAFAPVIAGLDSFRLDCLLGSLSEFGREEKGGRLQATRLQEHGECIAEGDVAERLFRRLA